MNKPKTRKAIILASTQGIGHAIAKKLRDGKYEIGLVSHNAENLAKSMTALDTKYSKSVDLYEPSRVRVGINSLMAEMDGVDTLVLNNGGPPSGNFSVLTLQHWKKGVDGLLLSMIEAIQAVLPTMLEQKFGRVIFISSLAVGKRTERFTLSSALRSAMEDILMTLSMQYKESGVTFHVIRPGFTRTNDHVAMTPGAASKVKYIEASEIADIAYDLVCHETSSTGKIVEIGSLE